MASKIPSQVNKNYINMPAEITIDDDAWYGDHASFWDYGYSAIMAIEAKDWFAEDFNPYYHSINDTIDKMDMDFLLNITKICAATVCELADIAPYKIVLTEPDGYKDIVMQGSTYKIQWVPQGDFTVSLWYSPTREIIDTKFITATNGLIGEYSWETKNIPPGSYYIYCSTAADSTDWSSGVITILSSELANVKIYPNPFYAAQDEQITFTNLAAESELKIYNLSAELVYYTHITNQQKWSWKGKNNSGEEIGSGMYTYLLSTPTGRKATGKIVIIR